MFIIKLAGKILLQPVWLILFVIGLAVKMTVRHRLHSCLQICAEICESQNFGRNASRVERSKPVYYCHGYLVRKTDGRIIRCCDRMKKTI